MIKQQRNIAKSMLLAAKLQAPNPWKSPAPLRSQEEEYANFIKEQRRVRVRSHRKSPSSSRHSNRRMHNYIVRQETDKRRKAAMAKHAEEKKRRYNKHYNEVYSLLKRYYDLPSSHRTKSYVNLVLNPEHVKMFVGGSKRAIALRKDVEQEIRAFSAVSRGRYNKYVPTSTYDWEESLEEITHDTSLESEVDFSCWDD